MGGLPEGLSLSECIVANGQGRQPRNGRTGLYSRARLRRAAWCARMAAMRASTGGWE